MSLFSLEEKEKFENVGVGVNQIEEMLPEKYHPIFKELIEAIVSEEITEVLVHPDDGTTPTSIKISKKADLLVKIRLFYPYLKLGE